MFCYCLSKKCVVVVVSVMRDGARAWTNSEASIDFFLGYFLRRFAFVGDRFCLRSGHSCGKEGKDSQDHSMSFSL